MNWVEIIYLFCLTDSYYVEKLEINNVEDDTQDINKCSVKMLF